ncbi:molybdopterin guanine dinucleotide synthesis protein B [Megasphaera sp. NM10]|nr:molybdopterin guanine dinucleotide synthesis protein B [Megasphaera sp. NM10]
MTKILRPLSLGLIILAGGRSTRMGRDKTALPWRDTDLLTDLLLRSQAYPFTERLLSINRPYESSHLPAKLARTVRLVIDNYPDCGPLGGMEAALYSGQCDFYLVLSVDLPFYDFAPAPDLVKLLRRQPPCRPSYPGRKTARTSPWPPYTAVSSCQPLRTICRRAITACAICIKTCRQPMSMKPSVRPYISISIRLKPMRLPKAATPTAAARYPSSP